MIINHKSPSKGKRFTDKRDEKVKQGYTWNGAVFQIDERSQLLIAGRALKVVKRLFLGEEVEPIQWRLKNDAYYTFQPDEFLAFADSVDAHVESLMIESWQGKDAV